MKIRKSETLVSPKKLFALAALILILTLPLNSCSIRNMIKRCSFEFKSIKIGGMDFGSNKIEGTVTLEVNNPNWIPVKIKSVKCRLFIGNDKIFKGKSTSELRIPAGEKTDIEVPFKASYKQISMDMLKILMKGKGNMRVAGVAVIDAYLASIPVDFEVFKKD